MERMLKRMSSLVLCLALLTSGWPVGAVAEEMNALATPPEATEETGATETQEPSTEETQEPTIEVTEEPATEATEEPAAEATAEPAVEPTAETTGEPTVEPTAEATEEPVAEPTEEPVAEPTAETTGEPTVEPTTEPTVGPTTEPTAEATEEPAAEPTIEPTTEPTVEPAVGDSEGNFGSAPVYKFKGYKTLDDFGIGSVSTFSMRRDTSSSIYLNPQTIRPSSSLYGYRWICNRSGYSYPFKASFTLDGDYMPQNSVYIAIANYDCDEFGNSYSSEYDQVYVNGHCVGVLTGNNNTSNTTLLKVDRSFLKAGANSITIRVGIRIKERGTWYWGDEAGTVYADDPYYQWVLRVDDIQVLCDGGSAEGKPDVFRVNLTNAELSGNQVNCYVTTQIEDSKNRTFSLEYALYDWSSEESATYGQIIDDDFATIYDGNGNHEGFLTMPVDSLSGTYTAVVYLRTRENGTDTILAYDEESFEYETGIAPAFDVQNFVATPANLDWTSNPVAINLSADIDVNAGLTDLCFYISDAIQSPASVDANGHVTGTLAVPENGFYTVELRYTKEGKAYKKTTTFEIHNILIPLDAPVLNVSGDFNIAAGETVSIDWNAVENATAYSVIVWDFTGLPLDATSAPEVARVDDQAGLTYSCTFNKAGTYVIGVYSRCPGSTQYCQSRTAGGVNVYVNGGVVCDHSGLNYEYVLDTSIPVQYVDTGDGASHFLINSYSCICKDCGGFVGTVTDEYPNAATEAHVYDANGICVCGYVNPAGLPDKLGAIRLNIQQDDLVIEENFAFTWNEVEGADHYLFSLRDITDSNEGPLLYERKRIEIDEGNSLAVGLTAGRRYRAWICAVPEGMEYTAPQSSTYTAEFDYRIVPNFAVIGFNGNGQPGVSGTLTWSVPTSKNGIVVDPDQYVIYVYHSDASGTRQVYNAAVDGTTTSVTIDGSVAFKNYGLYTITVYATMYDSWGGPFHAVADLTPAYSIGTPEILQAGLYRNGEYKTGSRYGFCANLTFWATTSMATEEVYVYCNNKPLNNGQPLTVNSSELLSDNTRRYKIDVWVGEGQNTIRFRTKDDTSEEKTVFCGIHDTDDVTKYAAKEGIEFRTWPSSGNKAAATLPLNAEVEVRGEIDISSNEGYDYIRYNKKNYFVKKGQLSDNPAEAEPDGILSPLDGAVIKLFDGESIDIAWTPCEGADYYEVTVTDISLTESVASNVNKLMNSLNNTFGPSYSYGLISRVKAGETHVVYAARVEATDELLLKLSWEDFKKYYTVKSSKEEHALQIAVKAYRE